MYRGLCSGVNVSVRHNREPWKMAEPFGMPFLGGYWDQGTTDVRERVILRRNYFGNDRLRGVAVAGVKFPLFPGFRRHPYNTRTIMSV